MSLGLLLAAPANDWEFMTIAMTSSRLCFRESKGKGIRLNTGVPCGWVQGTAT